MNTKSPLIGYDIIVDKPNYITTHSGSINLQLASKPETTIFTNQCGQEMEDIETPKFHI